jgi:hypothetical protein
VLELWRSLTFHFGNDALCQRLAQLDAPLIKRVDVPDHALREDNVFVKRDKFTENFWSEPHSENRVRGTVALEDSMWQEPIGGAFSFDFFRRFAKSQCFGLGQDVSYKYIVMPT